MSMRQFEEAKREWESEVDTEAARLVKQGIPPFDALEQARRNVSMRRSGNMPSKERP